jgi:hypothetical protein
LSTSLDWLKTKTISYVCDVVGDEHSGWKMTMASCCVHSVRGDEHEEVQVVWLLRLGR